MGSMGKIEEYIKEELQNKKGLLFTLIDPDDHTQQNAIKTAKNANEAGTDLILIGGSTLSSQEKLDEVAKQIKERGMAKKVIGLAITGSFKGFDVINEV